LPVTRLHHRAAERHRCLARRHGELVAAALASGLAPDRLLGRAMDDAGLSGHPSFS
jgi:hypothetical protein